MGKHFETGTGDLKEGGAKTRTMRRHRACRPLHSSSGGPWARATVAPSGTGRANGIGVATLPPASISRPSTHEDLDTLEHDHRAPTRTPKTYSP